VPGRERALFEMAGLAEGVLDFHRLHSPLALAPGAGRAGDDDSVKAAR
jgi:hypothetical protein